MKITDITSEVFEWERPGIWNGGHFYGPGRLHKVTVKTDAEKVHIQKGDYVVFPKALTCIWTVIKPIKKYYIFK